MFGAWGSTTRKWYLVLIGLLEHLVATVAILDHAEGLRVLTPLISRGFWHRLGRFPVTLTSGALRISQLILCHQGVKLLGVDGRII